jgi:hypothetical protein
MQLAKFWEQFGAILDSAALHPGYKKFRTIWKQYFVKPIDRLFTD